MEIRIFFPKDVRIKVNCSSVYGSRTATIDMVVVGWTWLQQCNNVNGESIAWLVSKVSSTVIVLETEDCM